MPEAVAESVDEILECLSALFAAKELFLSDWYEATVERLFTEREQDVLEEIREENREETLAIASGLERWAAILASAGKGARAQEAFRVARHDVIVALYQVKQAAGDVLRLLAQEMPAAEVRERLSRLGEVDERHARALIRLLAGGGEALPGGA
jgi:hypothetical protein